MWRLDGSWRCSGVYREFIHIGWRGGGVSETGMSLSRVSGIIRREQSGASMGLRNSILSNQWITSLVNFFGWVVYEAYIIEVTTLLADSLRRAPSSPGPVGSLHGGHLFNRHGQPRHWSTVFLDWFSVHAIGSYCRWHWSLPGCSLTFLRCIS